MTENTFILNDPDLHITSFTFHIQELQLKAHSIDVRTVDIILRVILAAGDKNSSMFLQFPAEWERRCTRLKTPVLVSAAEL